MVVESHQIREIREDIVREFESREWYHVSGDRIELETKAETKRRMGCSPDLSDWLAIAVEGARRLGFQIETLRQKAETKSDEEGWLEVELSKFRRFVKKSELNYK
jgi:hypothetical protein